jgi:hypothetical protein
MLLKIGQLVRKRGVTVRTLPLAKAECGGEVGMFMCSALAFGAIIPSYDW